MQTPISNITRLYGLPIVSCSELKPDEFYVLSGGEVRKMEHQYSTPPREAIKTMSQDRLKTLCDYLAEKLPSIRVDAFHEPGAQLSLKLGGRVKHRYFEQVILPMLEYYAEQWNTEFRYSISEFGVATRWHWRGPFKVVRYPDNTALLSATELANQEELLDKMLP